MKAVLVLAPLRGSYQLMNHESKAAEPRGGQEAEKERNHACIKAIYGPF
jgi:hypothetical protein